MEREEGLVEFERARAQWQEAFARVPDGALTYLKPGDDYALGGLQVHVNWVLSHYLRVLQAITSANFAAVSAEDPPGAEALALRVAKRGLLPAERKEAVETMVHLHSTFGTAIAHLPAADWLRKCPVVYRPGEDPYPTSPEDILGWLSDHYREHVAQSAELIDEWEASTAVG